MASSDTRVWRVSADGHHLCAVNEQGQDEEHIGLFTRRDIALQVAQEHGLITSPYVDGEHQGGSWVDVLFALRVEITDTRSVNGRLREALERLVNEFGEILPFVPDRRDFDRHQDALASARAVLDDTKERADG